MRPKPVLECNRPVGCSIAPQDGSSRSSADGQRLRPEIRQHIPFALPPCDYRQSTAQASRFICTHSAVRAYEDTVSAEVCRGCTVLDQPSDPPCPVPSRKTLRAARTRGSPEIISRLSCKSPSTKTCADDHVAEGTNSTLFKDLYGRTNLLVTGVAHSGTTITARLLLALGWQTSLCLEADSRYLEPTDIVRLNRATFRRGALDLVQAREVVNRLPKPWMIKDPRFVDTLSHWLPVFESDPPTLIGIVRDLDSLKQSYRRHQGNALQEPTTRGHSLERQCEIAAEAFRIWPWSRIIVNFEDIIRAVSLFDLDRARHGPRV